MFFFLIMPKNQLTVVYFYDRRRPLTRKIRVAQKNVIEKKLSEIKRSIWKGIHLFLIRTWVFFQ